MLTSNLPLSSSQPSWNAWQPPSCHHRCPASVLHFSSLVPLSQVRWLFQGKKSTWLTFLCLLYYQPEVFMCDGGGDICTCMCMSLSHSGRCPEINNLGSVIPHNWGRVCYLAFWSKFEIKNSHNQKCSENACVLLHVINKILIGFIPFTYIFSSDSSLR